MIVLDHITKTYKSRHQTVTAVQDVSLRVEDGEIFGLIGYSGAGKSTLLRCINLLERPTAGRVEVDGTDLTQLGRRELQQARKKIGMIFQHFHLLNSASVADNVAFPLRLARVPRRAAMDKVHELLELVGLRGFEKHYPAQLSGGQKQRVAIARALANDPDVLLCDEATSALDPDTTQAILDLLLDIHRRLGLTMVMVTHEMSVIQRMCDRVAVMEHGKVVELGRVADVFLQPQHEVTRRLLNVDGRHRRTVLPSHATSAPVFEVTFVGDMTYAPVLAEVARETGASFSILEGSIGALKDVPYGKLLVAWQGEEDAVAAAVAALRTKGCGVEERRLTPVAVEV
ncbi:methionine import ATP-binding protein MetN 2 [Alicyclobacillus contaminans]|uniref:methionine ABC transporter ATP-binding protein n=1 Tax=Alicyclobacillus contaminans TaxID=392016 RepID=UPI0004043B43|nr:ATP-binding cassette domain-containing protein [Alicyclobacillus contaminans]GMA52213.1 methionine import ATP-binding protein MetN 2 [Alicyclobacillus contaminans]